MKFTINSPKQTEQIGFDLAKRLDERGIKQAFIALDGEMGVGKTVFTRGFASYFDISGVRSPTYTIVNEYRGARADIFHFDLYRIEDGDDLCSIGYDDYLRRQGYAIAEWSLRVPEDIPEDAIFVTINRAEGEEDGRIIEISDF